MGGCRALGEAMGFGHWEVGSLGVREREIVNLVVWEIGSLILGSVGLGEREFGDLQIEGSAGCGFGASEKWRGWALGNIGFLTESS